MDLNRTPVPFNSTINIRVRVALKSENRRAIVEKFGEDLYQVVLQSAQPLVVPVVRNSQVFIYIFV